MSLHTGVRGPGHLARVRGDGGGSPPSMPGATAFIPTESTHYPAGATVDVFHPTTAAITAAPRADGLPSFSALLDVTGTKTLTPGSGSNQGPILRTIPIYDQDNPSTLLGSWKALEFCGGELASLKDAVVSSGGKMAMFIVGKMHTAITLNGIACQGYPTADGGVLGDTTPNSGSGAGLLTFHYAGDTGAAGTNAGRGRTPIVTGGNRYLTDSTNGTDAASADKGLVQVAETTCVHWFVSRTTGDASLAGNGTDRRIRYGCNQNGVNYAQATGSGTGSGKGWTLGCTMPNPNYGVPAQNGNFTLYYIAVVRWTGAEMTFAQGQQLAADLQAHFDVRSHNARLLYMGDSRANEGTLTGLKARYRGLKSAGWPDGPLKTNVQGMQFGSGGSTLKMLTDWLPGGASQHVFFTNYPFPPGVGKTYAVTEWFHNDVATGTEANALYPGTTGSTTQRVDAVMLKYATLCGQLADTVSEVWPMSPMASAIGTTMLNYGRDTAGGCPNAFRSAAFVTTAQGGNPARIIRPLDAAAVTSTNLPLADKTTLAPTGTDVPGMPLFGNAVGTNDRRNPSTTGTDVYYLPDGAGNTYLSDLTHTDGGGSVSKGRIIGEIARQRLTGV